MEIEDRTANPMVKQNCMLNRISGQTKSQAKKCRLNYWNIKEISQDLSFDKIWLSILHTSV